MFSDQAPSSNLQAKSDDDLVALYYGEQATPEKKEQIRAELQVRYYPHHDPQQKNRPVQGTQFMRRVYAVLLASGIGREQLDECCERCCSFIFEKLFMYVDELEDLLCKFNPQRCKSSHPFRYWVINIRVSSAIIDWLRKQGKRFLDSTPPDETLLPEPNLPVEEVPAIELEEGGPWIWWDAFLPPRHGTVVRLLYLAYLDLNDYYLERVTKESGKTEDDVHTEVRLLKQRLRPAKRFGDSETIEIYTFNRMLESQILDTCPKDAQLVEAELEAIINDAARRTRWKFPDRQCIQRGPLKEMLLGALGGQFQVADFEQILHRWINLLEGELIEGELLALAEEIRRWEQTIKRSEGHLYRLGLGDQELAELAQSAEEFTIGKIKKLQKATTKGNERRRQSLAYQEHVARLHKAKHKRDKVLADYNSGNHLVTPLQRELATVLKVSMGTIGGRISKAKRALSGAIIWQKSLDGLAHLNIIAGNQYRLDRLRRTCILSFEDKQLKIGVPGISAVRWWNVLLPCIEAVLQKPLIQGTVEKYKQTGLTVVATNYRGDWPPLAPAWGDETSALE